MPTKIKQLVENEERFYPLTAAEGVVFQDGSYLSSKQFANNGTLTIQQDGTTIGTFSANASTNSTVNIVTGASADSVASAIYNSSTQKIEFYNATGTHLDTDIDATAFIKDGMVQNVVITTGTGVNVGKSVLKIDFNTDAEGDGHTDIEIPLENIFNPTNYYTKTETDNTFLSKSDYESDEEVVANALAQHEMQLRQVDSQISSVAGNVENLQGDVTTLEGKVDQTYTSEEKSKLANIAANAEVNVQADWNETNSTSDAYIQNKPTIPTVNDATLTIQKNGTSVGTFTANASSNVTVNVEVPTKTSDLTNDSGFLGPDEEEVISAALNKLNDDITANTSAIATKQNALTFDSTPTANSTNPVTSGGVYTALQDVLTNEDGEVISESLNDLNVRILANDGDIDELTATVDSLSADVSSAVKSVSFNGSTNYPDSSGVVSFNQTVADWNATSGYSRILNKPTIPTTVAQLTDAGNYVQGTKVTSVSSSSTDSQIPTAKAVYDSLSAAGKVDSVTLNGVAGTVTNKVANVTLQVNSTGSGNVITDVSLANNSNTIQVTKGSVDISSKEDVANKVTELSASSTDTQYPSAKAVYDELQTKLGESEERVISASLNDLNTRLEDIEDIVTFDTVPTGNSSKLVTSGAVYQAIANMTQRKQLITYTASDTFVENLAWDTVHKFPEMASLEFTIAAEPNDGYSHEITIIFDSGATATTLDYPTDVLWGRNVVLVPEANYRYEINIDDSNIAVFTEAPLPVAEEQTGS